MASKKSDVSEIREDEKSPKNQRKYRETIATLERSHGWGIDDHVYLYEGFWNYSMFLEGIMPAQEYFIAQPSDIILSSPPKSGTTWLKALAFAIVTRTRFVNSTSPLLSFVPHECVPFLEIDLSHRNATKQDPELPLVATHLPYTSLPKSIISSACKIVYIYRDPKDAFLSLWLFGCKLVRKDGEPLSLEEAFELFCKGISWYGPYWDHVVGYWKASLEFPGRLLVLKYEDVMRDTACYVKKLADFMGYSFSLEEEKEGGVEKIIELCSFESLSNLDVNKTGKHRPGTPMVLENSYYFRKGKIGDWKNHLTVEMAEKMDRISEHNFGSCGLIYSSKP